MNRLARTPCTRWRSPAACCWTTPAADRTGPHTWDTVLSRRTCGAAAGCASPTTSRRGDGSRAATPTVTARHTT